MSTPDAAETLVHLHVERGVATCTLDAPAKRNALSRRLTDDLAAHLTTVEADPDVRAIVLTHTGTTFCAGADLTESADEGGPAQSTGRLVELLRQIVVHPKPIIARIDGAVRGGGIGLVAACDLALATEASSFAFTEARLGVAPAVISLTVLPRLADRAAARWFLTGDRFDAPEAERMGLLTAAVTDVAALDAAVASLVASMQLCAPQGLAASKGLLTGSVLPSFDALADNLAAMSSRLFDSEEGREGIAAFRERRPPAWVVD